MPAASAVTSIKQVPGVLKKIVPVGPGHINIDLGAGRFLLGTHYLAQKGVANVTYDPFNLPPEHNLRSMKVMQQRIADSVTVANVLNVIPSKKERGEVILLAAASMKPSGIAYFSVYEGNKTGVRSGNQNNLKAALYVPEIERVFTSVERRGDTIIASGVGRVRVPRR